MAIELWKERSFPMANVTVVLFYMFFSFCFWSRILLLSSFGLGPLGLMYFFFRNCETKKIIVSVRFKGVLR